uniref:Uncharacterized protein n=1 Tax=Taeniopygia guttata TaxID=59729 RepID=A0A674H738_TAEGU
HCFYVKKGKGGVDYTEIATTNSASCDCWLKLLLITRNLYYTVQLITCNFLILINWQKIKPQLICKENGKPWRAT